MDKVRTDSVPTPQPQKNRNAGRAVGRGLVALLVLLALAAVGSGFWGYSEHSRADRLLEESGGPIAIVSAFEAAYESGDYDKVRALFTDDGIITTASNTHTAFYTGVAEEGAGVDGAEFHRLAALHGGDDLVILGIPTMVGDNTVAFGWRWSLSGAMGTAILHLRDGKIVIAILNLSQYRIPPGGG